MSETTEKKPKTPSQKMRDYRERMREQGLRPLQIWVPDTRATGFAKEARRQALMAAQGPDEKETMDFLEALEDWAEA